MSEKEQLRLMSARIYEIVNNSSNEYDAIERVEDYLSLITYMYKLKREDLSREG